MKLKYKLLWIENDIDWLESVEDDIKSMIEENAFVYDRYNFTQEEEGLDYNAYDLILMDLNLDSQPTGDQLIKKIRDNGIYTDVVFYSSGGLDNIKQKARDLNLEGVYFSGRNNVQFVEKVRKIVETTIRKVQDLNNLRGLVMAEVSELDAIMEQIVVKYFNSPERMTVYHNKITSDTEKWMHKNLENTETSICDKKCTLVIRNQGIEEISKNIDSSQKAHAVHELLKDINADGHISVHNKGFFETYKQEIIYVRNKLAHCESKTVDGSELLYTKDGEMTFAADDFKTIRSNVTKYNKLFNDILKEL